ncbi:MAG: RluA family pseudouridine synthase [Prevotellaceae bacterium]|jgi:23S rRNA pseudouridine1911/1915/1917 synthase|nr:RluA family pseudouridine synthase [Prevotellaceae bacterium]
MSVEQRILFEDNHLLVMNKLPGEIVQADKSGDASLSDLVSLMIKERDHKPGNVFLGVPHRLDRPASGATLFAKTGKALTRLNEMFRSREMEKKYWAITLQKPEKESMQLIHYLMRNEKQNKSHLSLLPKSGAKEAVLRYRFLCSSDKYHLLEVELFTGRHHQIRAQLATIGCVIKGDLKYGAPRSNSDGGICLHARSLSFIHPVKKERIEINAPVPQDALWQWFESQSR